MTEESVTTANPEGVARTPEGAIADVSQTTTAPAAEPSANTTQPSTESNEAAPADSGKTLLTEGEKPKVEAKDGKPEGAPEKYEDYKVPDGFTLDPEVKTQADQLFKGLGLSQDQAQSLVDFYTKQTTDAAKAPYNAWNKMTSEWRKTSEDHPDLRGKIGPGQEINVRIGKALDSLGDSKLASEFRALMDLTGAGNHPAFIRVINSWAQRVTEGSHVAGRGPTKEGQSAPGSGPVGAAAALWPNLPSARG